jgi:LPS O-antigen subunit length determinant protein (WzzB/FepE family)
LSAKETESGRLQGEAGFGDSSSLPEVDMAGIVRTIWEARRRIVVATMVFGVVGVAYALLATPMYESQATITLKESGKGGAASGLFSQLGGLGGALISQLGAGNVNLPRMELILKGNNLAESVVVKNDLMPVLFSRTWDSDRKTWKTSDPKKIPRLRQGANLLREKFVEVSTDEKKDFILIKATMPDSLLARKVVVAYLDELNLRLRRTVITDADSNRRYLERQLATATDPVLYERIQSLIAGEIEKSMLMSSRSFEVLEEPLVPQERSHPRRYFIVAASLLGGFVASIAGVFLAKGFRTARAAFASAVATRRDT